MYTVYVCSYVQILMHMYIQDARGQPWVSFLKSYLSCLLREAVLLGPVDYSLSFAGWPACPRDLPVSGSLALGLQAHTATSVFRRVLEIRLGSSSLCDKHFTNKTVSVLYISFACWQLNLGLQREIQQHQLGQQN